MECTPRTHRGTLDRVCELREWNASLSALKAEKTDSGIFALHFASEYLLNDIIHDVSTDIMHFFYCGMTRYLISWLTDILIPDFFSWATLNERKKQVFWLRGCKVPDLEKSIAPFRSRVGRGETVGVCRGSEQSYNMNA